MPLPAGEGAEDGQGPVAERGHLRHRLYGYAVGAGWDLRRGDAHAHDQVVEVHGHLHQPRLQVLVQQQRASEDAHAAVGGLVTQPGPESCHRRLDPVGEGSGTVERHLLATPAHAHVEL